MNVGPRKLHIANATRRALADRALRAANQMEFWAEGLYEEMKKQNISHIGSADGQEPFILTRRHARMLLSQMTEMVAEIRKFSPLITK